MFDEIVLNVILFFNVGYEVVVNVIGNGLCVLFFYLE